MAPYILGLLLVATLLGWPAAQQQPTPLPPCEIAATSLFDVALVRPADGSVRPLGSLLIDRRPRVIPSGQIWLPDGQRIVVMSMMNRRYSVFVGGTTTLNRAELITDDFYQFATPTLSPDGAWIGTVTHVDLRQAERDLTNVMVLHHIESGEQVVLDPLEGDAFYFSPQWSPDGTQLLFDAERANRSRALWRVHVDGTGLMQILDKAAYSAAWSPDGDSGQIAVSLVRGGLYLVEADSSHHLLADGLIQDVAWSPNGTQIAATRRTGAGPVLARHELIMVDVATGIVTVLTDGSAYDGRPVWSPTGQQIAFVSDRIDPVYPDLWLMNADGSNARPLTEHVGISWAHAPAWNPVTCANE